MQDVSFPLSFPSLTLCLLISNPNNTNLLCGWPSEKEFSLGKWVEREEEHTLIFYVSNYVANALHKS